MVSKMHMGKGFIPDLKCAPSLLHDRYSVPPFSILNTREGPWLEQKRKWIELGIESEVGRNAKVYNDHEWAEEKAGRAEMAGDGTSIFDPTLCEIVYNWWCPPGGVIVDPFAGGSVRGIVASYRGFKYWGSELRQEQVDANRAQINDRTCGEFRPKWICGDSCETIKTEPAPRADFLFSCPPYGDLERYSDDPRDISSIPYDAFLRRYGEIIALSCERLREHRFAVWVVGNFRDRKTRIMRDFVGDSIRLFADSGLGYYNDIVLMNMVGTACLRAEGNFERGARKVVKLHQNVLVFVKGDPKRAAERIGNIPKGE